MRRISPYSDSTSQNTRTKSQILLEIFYFGYGAAAGIVITLAIASFMSWIGTGGGGGGGFINFNLDGLIRFVIEAVLVGGFIAALVGTAILNTAPAWHMFLGYAGVRAIGLLLEFVYYKGRHSH